MRHFFRFHKGRQTARARGVALALVDRNVSGAVGGRDGVCDRVVEQRMIAVVEFTIGKRPRTARGGEAQKQ